MQIIWPIFALLSSTPLIVNIDVGTKPTSVLLAKEVRLNFVGRNYANSCGLLAWLAAEGFRLRRFEHGGEQLVLQRVEKTPLLVMVDPFFPNPDWREFVAIEILDNAKETNQIVWHSVIKDAPASGKLKVEDIDKWLKKDFPSVRYIAISVGDVLDSKRDAFDIIINLSKMVDNKVAIELDCQASLIKSAKRGEKSSQSLEQGPGHPFSP